jgi:AraC-like DNA-binding protein
MSRDPERVCILVNPWPLGREVQTRLASDRRVMIFDDLESLERWRSRCTSSSGLACEVARALREIGHDCTRLPHDMAQAVARLARQSMTPTVSEFARNGHSERTFYRRWNEVVRVRPKQFLNRVRFLHALRLIEQLGCSVKEAAALAGYGSADRLRADARLSRTQGRMSETDVIWQEFSGRA